MSLLPSENMTKKHNNVTKKRRIRQWIARGVLGAIVLLVACLLWPDSTTLPKSENDEFQAFLNDYSAWLSKVETHQVDAEEKSPANRATALSDELDKLIQQLQEAHHGEAEPIHKELLSRSGMEFGTEEEVQRHNADSEALCQQLTSAQERAKSIAGAIHEKTETMRKLFDEEDKSGFSAVTNALVEEGQRLSNRLGFKGTPDTSTLYWKLRNYLSVGTTGTDLANAREDIDRYMDYLEGLKEADQPDKNRFLQKLESYDTVADELLADFPTGKDYVLAKVNPDLAPLRVLEFGGGDLSVGAEGDLGEALVAPLVRAWLHQSGYTFSEQKADNGIRLTIRESASNERHVDIITISHADATKEAKHSVKGAHIVFYSSGMKLENVEEKLCSDAMVIVPVEGQEKLGLDEIIAAPKYLFAEESANGIAADLHGMRSSKAETITSADELLKQPLTKMLIGAYHKLVEQVKPDEMVHIRYPGEHAYAPTFTNIATGQYWYVYDINFHQANTTRGWEKEKLSQFLLTDAAKSIIKSNNFIPLGLNECPEIQQLDETSYLPIQEVLARIDALGFRKKMHYGANHKLIPTLRGCQLPYPINFPTGKADGMQLDSNRIKSVVDSDLRKHIDLLAKKYTWLVVVVCGYADVRPFTSMSNEELSQQRADKFLNNIVIPATRNPEDSSDYILKPDERGQLKRGPYISEGLKPVRTPGSIFVNAESNILVTTMGCGTNYALVSELKNPDSISQDEVDEHYRRDRRASIFVIVPSIDADAVRERPGQDSAPE